LADGAGRRRAAELGHEQGEVASRRQLIAAGVPRWFIRSEVAARRWQEPTGQTVVLHNGPLTAEQKRWVAVLGTGPRAALDGVSALQAAGIDHLDDEDVHVIAPQGSQPRRAPGVVIHESRRFNEDDVIAVGLRRTRPAVAAVHAALWAVTDRQAQFLVMTTVQQKLATPGQVADALSAVRRHARRRLLLQLVADLGAGVETLGELDVAADFRRRGFPEPDRQVVRRRPSGTQYLDCELPAYDLVFEIDGAGHALPQQQLSDLLRDLATAAEGQTTVRIPLALYRLDRERMLDQIEALLVARGWRDASDAA
jgi:very-short-patch-repair endonuclease